MRGVLPSPGLLTTPLRPLVQEYLRLSDVYKMYGNSSLPSRSSSPAALHCLASLSVAPALPCEVDARRLSLPLTCSAGQTLNVLPPLSPLLSPPRAKDYITVSQLSQIFGMQRLDPTSSSSLPSFQLATSETTFSCHSTPSAFSSAQVCCTSSPPFPFLPLANVAPLISLHWYLLH